jgi:hypothetical protein
VETVFSSTRFLSGWELLDNNPATKQIAAAGGNLYQRHNNGLIWMLWERKDDTYGSLRLAVVAEIHATNFLSSLVHEGVADFMSRFATGNKGAKVQRFILDSSLPATVSLGNPMRGKGLDGHSRPKLFGYCRKGTCVGEFPPR